MVIETLYYKKRYKDMIIEIEKLSFKISALSCFVATVTVELPLKPSTNSQLGTPSAWILVCNIIYSLF